MERNGKEENVGDAADAAPPREDVQALCDHLRRRVIANGSRVNITGKWRDAARLLIDRDKRPIGEAHALIDWCQDSEFWRPNVQSLPKFREKYDTLRLQAQRKSGTPRQQAEQDMWERAYARAEAREIGVDR